MSNAPILITQGSWEDRFREGSLRLIQEYTPQKVLMFFSDVHAEIRDENREEVVRVCQDHKIELLDRELKVTDRVTDKALDSVANWKTLRDTILQNIPEKSEVIVDLSTMPREVIWTLFWLLDLRQTVIHYVYHRPQGYGKWLSRDPQWPRLVYKMSGLSKLGARTVLMVLAGYDVDRVRQLRLFFEPAVTLLGLQEPDRDTARMEQHMERFGSDSTVKLFKLNAFAKDHGQSAVEAQVEPYIDSHNVIMSSLGPKLSAVSLYRIHQRHPEIGLVYAPAREFNKEYSTGIGEAIEGIL